ncbi:NAD-dependent epimerase/dehydratase family protein [Phreatobacter aquaticus]|uniref:NAD-dependent epimerase/dehydratase family protein n=1 Tax=Phreatobacter aquaticus TaxID=2570229 RepID=A0A4D7QL99_9HYPH|nr:NAD-dependent epimerase/dehydratase family protein [Phreatobacter aquaticus]QCK85947.1 NAD-dependent epimerase/dehydratase family protein [Phreatobacter aquaticus]
MATIIVTGAAGLVGQNLIARLKTRPGTRIIGIDKHPANTALLRRVHPEIEVIEADLAVPGAWADAFAGADAVVINQAQIGGLDEAEFVANNVTATEHIVAAARTHAIPYFVQISSSVVNSVADDFYTRSKTAQERFIDTCDIPHAVLRPTLMFGWFDRKHLGWLRRFMDRTPVFPIPGDGRYIRQPLYVGDFVAVIMSCLERRTTGTFDISGREQIDYGDLIKLIHTIVRPKARIVHIPYGLFWLLLTIYGLVDRNPPFTTSQLAALVIPETFPVIDWPGIFQVQATPLRQALEETYLDPRYAGITLEF